jgi:hypothetical protein
MLLKVIFLLLASIFSIVDAQGSGDGSGAGPDRGLNCKENANLCANPIYQALMARECAQTCRDCANGGCRAENPRLVLRSQVINMIYSRVISAARPGNRMAS